MSDQQKPDNSAETQQESSIPLSELIRTRLEKARQLRAKGVNPYPYRFERTHAVSELLDDFDALAEKEAVVRVAGRLMLIRKMGKVFFADLRDQTEKIQIYVRKNDVGENAFAVFNTMDMGDIVGVEGYLFVTRTGERTVHVNSFELLAKALHPLPDKHSGLTDKETRYRRRYADLLVNPEVRETFRTRTTIIQTVREFLNNEGFLEVETPILQPLYGGASARPFKTHHFRLDMPMYLRIADELYLKRLIVGGYEKVWEFCKDFRNEGLDRLHNPEFSMIELYWAFADYRDIARLVEQLFRHTVKEVCGTYKIPYGEHEIDFEPPFKWVRMGDAVREATGVDFAALPFEEGLKEAEAIGIDTERLTNRGKVIEAVFDEKVEPGLIQPIFIVDHPVEISPLAKRHRDNPDLAERFEVFIAGGEFANAFSELNDPMDQLERFLEQGKALEAGDEEAQPLDDDFITALAYGMPPTGGLGIGMDRLIMLLTNQHSIRDVLLFPQMKDMREGTVPVSRILRELRDTE
jgi:lysyl-tRNA synthetase class 2